MMMKTNQIMRRQLGAMEVQQRTKDGMFNATAFLQQWNEERNESRRIVEFLRNDNTQEFIEALAEDLGKESNTPKKGDLKLIENQEVANVENSPHLGVIDNQHVTNTENPPLLKGIEKQEISNTWNPVCFELSESQQVPIHWNSSKLKLTNNQQVTKQQKREFKPPKTVMVTARGNNGGTWMHPLLFIKFAMWLNPRFEVQVLKFVQDKMLQYRNDAGEAYKELSSAVGRIVGKDHMREVMKTVGKGINYILWNSHEDGERNNHAEESEMRRLFDYERHIASLINDEFIGNAEQLMTYLRRQWSKKWNPIKALA